MTAQRIDPGHVPTVPSVRRELVGQAPYGAPQLAAEVCLNVNENPHRPPQHVVDAIAEQVRVAAGTLNRYPDRDAVGLRQDLAGYLGHDLGVDRVWVANGSNEVMLQVLQAYGGPGRSALAFTPSYSMYPLYARTTSTTWVEEPRLPDFSLDLATAGRAVRQRDPDVVLLASPNNPTGTALKLEVIDEVCQACKGIVVVDEAYAEFRRPGSPSALALLAQQRNLVVVRTMSKAFGLAGLRLGYLAGDREVVDALRVVRMPYHVSAVTQAAASAALAHAPELLAPLDELREERDRTVDWLRATSLRVPDSDANFALFGTYDDAHAVWQGLLDQGVLVRETGPRGWLRVSIGTAAQMARFRTALTAVTADLGLSVRPADDGDGEDTR